MDKIFQLGKKLKQSANIANVVKGVGGGDKAKASEK